jgi:hypothetical protein
MEVTIEESEQLSGLSDLFEEVIADIFKCRDNLLDYNKIDQITSPK